MKSKLEENIKQIQERNKSTSKQFLRPLSIAVKKREIIYPSATNKLILHKLSELTRKVLNNVYCDTDSRSHSRTKTDTGQKTQHQRSKSGADTISLFFKT